MAQYGKPEYWEDRYAKDPEPFDWYQRYAALKGVVGDHLKKSHVVLNAGCGNSRLSEEMYEDGYGGNPAAGGGGMIVNIDISRTVIDAMAERHRDKPGMTWQVMNVCALSFPDGHFDAVVDKGTMDSLLCGENSTANTGRYASEVSRVLKPGGVFIVVSYGSPENRLSYLENDDYGWRVTVHTLPKPSIAATGMPETATDPTQVHYVYICTRTS